MTTSLQQSIHLQFILKMRICGRPKRWRWRVKARFVPYGESWTVNRASAVHPADINWESVVPCRSWLCRRPLFVTMLPAVASKGTRNVMLQVRFFRRLHPWLRNIFSNYFAPQCSSQPFIVMSILHRNQKFLLNNDVSVTHGKVHTATSAVWCASLLHYKFHCTGRSTRIGV